ncbi:MAG: MFS transporter [Marinobacterium sp.]|nr:MFS transporter [Marinobacterium sp.]
MLLTLLPLFSLLFSGFLLMLGHGLTGILLPVRMEQEAMSTDTIGLVLSLFAVGFLLGGIYSRALIMRAGHIRMFAACGALASISVLLSGLFTDPYVLGAMRILMGFCLACANAAIDSWLSDSASEETRGRILAINQVVLMAAMVTGQFMLNIASPAGTTLFMAAAIIFSLSVVPLSMTRRASPSVADVDSMSLRTAFRYSPLGLVTCFACGLLYASLLNMLPLFAKSHGLVGFDLTLFMGAALLGAFVLQFPVGYLSDRFDRRTVLLGLLIIATACSSFIPVLLSQGQLIFTMLLLAIHTGILACLYPMSISETFDKVQKKDLVAAMGALLIAYALGSLAGPYTASLVMKQINNDALFLFLAIAQSGLIIFVMHRMRVRVALPVAEQETFVAQSAATAAVATDLDPRTEYVEPEQPLTQEAEVAIEVARTDPGAAVRMARALAEDSPEQAARISAAIASLDSIDAIRLYDAMVDVAPEHSLDIAEAIASNSPEQASELVKWTVQSQPESTREVVVALANVLPERWLELVETAADEVDTPEDLLELARSYAESLAENLEQLRPVDRIADTSTQQAAEMYSRLSEMVPDQAADLAYTVAEAMPEAASEITEAYVNTLTDDTPEPETAAITSTQPETADTGQTSDVTPATETSDEATDPAVVEAATEFVSNIADRMPEQAVDVAATVAEAIPEAASDLVDLLQDADQLDDTLVSSLDERPVESPFDEEVYLEEVYLEEDTAAIPDSEQPTDETADKSADKTATPASATPATLASVTSGDAETKTVSNDTGHRQENDKTPGP